MKKRRRRIKINVSGEQFETYEDTLERYPETLLGKKKSREPFFCSRTNQYFFDRSRVSFEAILYFYQSNGTLNCPPDVKIPIFESECRYFELPGDTIHSMKIREGIIFEKKDNKSLNVELKMKILNILENPDSSISAWFFGVFSLVMCCLSIITAFLETLPTYIVSPIFSTLELTLNLWFVTELALRFIFSRDKVRFIRVSMNWVDFCAVVPYFIVELSKTKAKYVLGVFKTLKFLRVMRLFRLSKHSRRLMVVGIILKSSLGNFKLLLMCLVMVIFIGGSFIHVAEHGITHAGDNTGFSSIPQGLWWAAQTITSVGYGDLVPTSIIGRLFAGFYMLFGVLTISLPVLSIVTQFTTMYPKNVDWDLPVYEFETGKSYAIKEN